MTSYTQKSKKTGLIIKCDSPKMINNKKSSLKTEISIDNMLKYEQERRNSESPSPNSVSDDSLFDETSIKPTKKVTFHNQITVINNNNNNNKNKNNTVDNSPNSHQINNHELMRSKRAFIRKLKLDQDSREHQEECGVKSCSTDVNDYVCTIQ